jgi:hypothetical protein
MKSNIKSLLNFWNFMEKKQILPFGQDDKGPLERGGGRDGRRAARLFPHLPHTLVMLKEHSD